MTAALYDWPARARFGRPVPKSKFYETGAVRGGLRGKLVDQVQQITWAYKLADGTLNLPASDGLREIQVFEIETKTPDVGDDILTAIDRAIHFPILFEIHSGDGTPVRMAAAMKVLGDGSPKVGGYLTSEWMPGGTPRTPLPPAVSMSSLYDALITPLLPFGRRRGEAVTVAAARMEQARRLEREITALQRKLRAEPQLNRKVELRRRITDLMAALSELTAVLRQPGGR